MNNSDVLKAKAADGLSILPMGHRSVGEPAAKKVRVGSNENVVYNITINVGENSTCSGLSLFGDIYSNELCTLWPKEKRKVLLNV